jgi:hypothetical protein
MKNTFARFLMVAWGIAVLCFAGGFLGFILKSGDTDYLFIWSMIGSWFAIPAWILQFIVFDIANPLKIKMQIK